MKNKLFLIIIVLISFSLRLFSLSSIPDGIHHDEISFANNAYSIFKTGKDEYGKKLPIIFQSFGDYKLPVTIYLMAPFNGIFGLNDFWTRFPTAFIGALTPLAVFLLARKIFRADTPALLSAAVLAISPWHILFSRSVNESVIAVFAITIMSYFFIDFCDRFSVKKLLMVVLFFLIAIFSYRASYIFLPLLMLYIGLIKRDHLRILSRRNKFILILSVLVLTAVSMYTLFFIIGGSRFKDVGLFSSAGMKLQLEEQIREDGLQNTLITRVFHNKPANFIFTVFTNYISHFDFTYLFISGDKLSLNNSTPNMGHLLVIELPFLLIGIYMLIKNQKENIKFTIPLFWLLIGPFGSTLTVDSPSAVRNLISVIGFSLCIGYGLYFILEKLNTTKPFGKLLIVFVIFFYGINFVYFVHNFTVHKKIHRPWTRDVGLKDIISVINSQGFNYDKIVFADYPNLYSYFVYYNKINPQLAQNINLDYSSERQKAIMSSINSKYLIMDKDCTSRGQMNVLYICRGDKIPKRAKVQSVIRYADGLPAFISLEFQKTFDPGKISEPPDRIGYINDQNSDRGLVIKSGSSEYW